MLNIPRSPEAISFYGILMYIPCATTVPPLMYSTVQCTVLYCVYKSAKIRNFPFIWFVLFGPFPGCLYKRPPARPA
jgi:hypothetical protein